MSNRVGEVWRQYGVWRGDECGPQSNTVLSGCEGSRFPRLVFAPLDLTWHYYAGKDRVTLILAVPTACWGWHRFLGFTYLNI